MSDRRPLALHEQGGFLARPMRLRRGANVSAKYGVALTASSGRSVLVKLNAVRTEGGRLKATLLLSLHMFTFF
jgi:hypothetical protein